MWDVWGLRIMNFAMNSEEKWWASRQVGDKGGLGGPQLRVPFVIGVPIIMVKHVGVYSVHNMSEPPCSWKLPFRQHRAALGKCTGSRLNCVFDG